ncbi:MAG: proline racemase family protein [Chloroflexota bacterium]
MRKIHIIDSHTGGEPTRIVYDGGPSLVGETIAEQLVDLWTNHDDLRKSVVLEPRGFDAVVGGLLCAPTSQKAVAGIIFFNNDGYLGMCGHGTIGLIATLAHMGKIQPGEHLIDTPVGTVGATLHEDGEVTVDNVASYRYATGVTVSVEGYPAVTGDVAWGGNWFFLVDNSALDLHTASLDDLTDYTWRIRQGLEAAGITGADGAAIDHIELFTKSQVPGAHSKNFVLCPGKVYDRSPCGTGTSAKMACLYADGKLTPDDAWVQESIIGSVFRGRIRVDDGKVYPSITGKAHISAETTLLFDPDDPFKQGIQR